MLFENKLYNNKLLLNKKSVNFIKSQHLLMDKYDTELIYHSIGVAEISYLLGVNCNDINFKQLSDLYFSALIHDIGKIFLSRKILNKPGRLNSREMNYVQNHSNFGANYIKKEFVKKGSPGLNKESQKNIIFNIKHHHELLDGSGYPDRIGYKKLTLSAQVLTLADVYSALNEKRVYKDSWNTDKIFDYLNQYSQKWFNKDLINCLENIIYQQKSVNW